MNLYEFEGKYMFEGVGIAIPKGSNIKRDADFSSVYNELGITDVVVKAQVLSGKRGKNNAIRFCNTEEDTKKAITDIFAMQVKGQHVAAVRVEEKLDIAEEHYMSITYDTNAKQPVLVYSSEGGVDIEDVEEEKILKLHLDIRNPTLPPLGEDPSQPPLKGEEDMVTPPVRRGLGGGLDEIAQKLWECFKTNDTRLVEINPLVRTGSGEWIAADSKVAIDDDAFFRHDEWKDLEPRTMLGRPATEREIEVKKIDEGEKYYQGTAGKYIEMDGDIACLFIGGGASIANMDAMESVGLKPANYTEYSGNPPREKVRDLTKIVLSKPGIRGLWIVGGVSNFTNVKETFMGTADALAEVMPEYPIVVRRDGPFGAEGKEYFMNFAKEKDLDITWFGKDVPMSETAQFLADKVNGK